MQTLKIIDGIRAQAIADDIIMLIKSEKSLSIYATGVDAIKQTISGIDLAKRILELERLFLDIEHAFPQKNTKDDLTERSVSFQIRSSPTFIEIDLSKPAIEIAI